MVSLMWPRSLFHIGKLSRVHVIDIQIAFQAMKMDQLIAGQDAARYQPSEEVRINQFFGFQVNGRLH